MNEFTLDINVNSKRWLNPNYLTRLLPCSQIPALYYNDSYVFNLNLYNEDLTPYVIPENPTIVFAGDVNRDHSDCLMLYVTGSEIEVIDAEQGKLRLTFKCWRESFYNKAGCDMIVNLKINDATVLEDRLFAKVGAYSGEIPGGDGCITNYNDLEDRPKINGVTLEGDKTSEELHITQVQSDWDESDSSEPSYIRNKPTHFEQVQADWDESDSEAADYIKNKPVIPDPQVQADWDESDSEAVSYILNKPVIPEPAPQEQADWDESDSTAVDYIKNKPIIPEPVPQVQSDWDESDSSDPSYIQNKPAIPEPVSQVQADWDESDSSDVTYIQNKPNLSVYMPKAGGTFTGPVVIESTESSASFQIHASGTSNGLSIRKDGYTVTLGTGNVATGNYGSIAIGYLSSASGSSGCVSIGHTITNTRSQCVAIGKYNTDIDAYLVIGNGVQGANNNCFVVDRSGNVEMDGDLTFTPAGGTSTTLSDVLASIPDAQVQSNWDEVDSTAVDYIKNKPTIPSTAAEVGALSLEGGTLTGNLIINRDSLPRPQIQLIFNNNAGFSVNNNNLRLGGNLTVSEVYGSVAIGYQDSTTGGYGCMTLGQGLTNAVNSSLVVGKYNDTDTDYILLCGNGTATDSKSNAFTVYTSGNATLAGDLTFTPAGGTPTTLSTVMSNFIPKQGDFGAPLSENATVINLTNAAGNIVRYNISGGIGFITIGSEANASFYTVLSGRETRVTGSISVSVNTPVVNLNKVNNALAINVGGKKIYDASTEDFSLPANLDVAGTLTTAGTEIVAATTTIVPQDNKVYQHTLADSEVLTIDTSALTSNHQVQFELHLTQPSSPVAFTLPSNIVWSAGTDFASGNPAPVINSGDTLYCIVLRWTGRRLLGSLAYTEYVGDISDSSSEA